MQKNIILSLLSLFFGSQFLVAQQKTDSAFVQLSDVEVSASRKLYSEMGRILTVIGKTEIKQSAVQSIDQLLDYVAGIDIRQRGVNTTQADISVRGGSFDQVLVLLNGVNITDPQTGHFNLDIPLNISDVSRVEILQGSAARVLGPNAFSGAINIVTETASRLSLNAELTGGSFNTFGPSVSGNFGGKTLRTFASVSHKSSDGYMANTDFSMSNIFVQSVLRTPNVGKFNFQLAGQLKDMGENGFYSLKYPNQREANKTLFAAVDWQLTKGKFILDAQASGRSHYDRYELDHNMPAGFKYHLTDVVNGKINGSYVSLLGKTTLGLSVRNEHIFSNALGTKMYGDSIENIFDKGIFYKYRYNRTVYSSMLDHSVKLGSWYMSAGLATSYSNDFGATTYGGFDLAYFVADHIKIYASANSATRLPSFTDMFFENPVQQGNLELKPEMSQVLELGTKVHNASWSFYADAYYRRGRNVIDWVKLTNTSTKYVAMNLSEVNARGGDLSFEYYFDKMFVRKVSVAYSYLALDKNVEGVDSKYALDYLKNKISLGLNHGICKNISATWNAGYYDRAGSYDANRVVGASSVITNYLPYFLLDLRILWNLKKLDVFADANNLLDTKYADYGGLIQPGIYFNAGVRLKL